jgi:hypothetical protein
MRRGFDQVKFNFARQPFFDCIEHHCGEIRNSELAATQASPRALLRMNCVVASGLTPTEDIWTNDLTPRASQARTSADIAT